MEDLYYNKYVKYKTKYEVLYEEMYGGIVNIYDDKKLKAKYNECFTNINKLKLKIDKNNSGIINHWIEFIEDKQKIKSIKNLRKQIKNNLIVMSSLLKKNFENIGKMKNRSTDGTNEIYDKFKNGISLLISYLNFLGSIDDNIYNDYYKKKSDYDNLFFNLNLLQLEKKYAEKEVEEAEEAAEEAKKEAKEAAEAAKKATTEKAAKNAEAEAAKEEEEEANKKVKEANKKVNAVNEEEKKTNNKVKEAYTAAKTAKRGADDAAQDKKKEYMDTNLTNLQDFNFDKIREKYLNDDYLSKIINTEKKFVGRSDEKKLANIKTTIKNILNLENVMNEIENIDYNNININCFNKTKLSLESYN